MGKAAKETSSAILNYVNKGLNSYIADNPDTDYQRGHLRALYEVRKFIIGEEI